MTRDGADIEPSVILLINYKYGTNQKRGTNLNSGEAGLPYT
jgi:hypothetical protein